MSAKVAKQPVGNDLLELPVGCLRGGAFWGYRALLYSLLVLGVVRFEIRNPEQREHLFQ